MVAAIRQTDQPRTLLRLFIACRLSDGMNRLTVGGSMNWHSAVYTIVRSPKGKERAGQGSYAIVNLVVRYQHIDI